MAATEEMFAAGVPVVSVDPKGDHYGIRSSADGKAFAQRLYRQAGDEPLHLLLVRAEDAQMVGAWQRLVKMGRFKGIGVTLVSQRSAAVNKDVLEQVDNLIVLRTTGPRDREAIKRWVDTHADREEIIDSLPSLANVLVDKGVRRAAAEFMEAIA